MFPMKMKLHQKQTKNMLLTFSVDMRLPEKLPKEARNQLATAVTPPQALSLAAKAANIARKSANNKLIAATA